MREIRQALRRELESRGFSVADDTVSSRDEIYVKGEGDLAAALFEFKPTVQVAMDTMYQGNWSEGLPPRFAVLPTDAFDDPYFEVLKQMRIIPLLYGADAEDVTFPGLDDALAHLGG